MAETSPTAPHLTRNAIRCNRCQEVIESRHRHDLVRCACGDSFVDGGLDYQRRGHGPAGFTDLSAFESPSARP